MAGAADKDKPRFDPGPASSYPNRQTGENKVMIAARPYVTDEEARAPFGKLNPNKHGVLPVLVVIQNGSERPLKLESLRVEYVGPDRSRTEATPAEELAYLSGPRQPKVISGPFPGRAPRISRKKSPLSAWEIGGRAFSAKMLPAGETASGFFYFQTGHRRGSQIYITGIREAGTEKELFYFEIPLSGDGTP
ncbi:MAG: hypothetical protein WD696_22540 [Bryobacteraceae bacterium]